MSEAAVERMTVSEFLRGRQATLSLASIGLTATMSDLRGHRSAPPGRSDWADGLIG